jgi:4-amino-4-deoxy-L-arabinose transferase-like glycosyltransferase
LGLHAVINSFATRALSSVSGFFEASQSAAAARVSWERSILIGILLLGTFVRFWGLGEIGLHREDEDTTGLAAIHILEDGVPRYPTGMAYGRAIVQSYLIAGSVYFFGNTEWALRLPSALCGVLLIVLAYFLGRRFLNRFWNLVFTATVAFLPGLILASQTARMYIFLLACLAGYAILVFAWERTGKVSRLVWAILLLILGMQFQTIAIFATPLLFFPALLHADARKFWWACGSAIVVYCAYVYVDFWVGELYIEPELAGGIGGGAPTQAARVPQVSPVYIAASASVALVLGFALVRRIGGGIWRLIAAALILAAFACQLLLQYHLAMLAFAAGSVIALRVNRRVLPLIVVASLIAAVLAVAQMITLDANGIELLRNKVGVMVGMQSVLAYVSLAGYSVGAVVICGFGVLMTLWDLANKRPIADTWLMLLLWGWIPLLAFGAFLWNPAPRYTLPALLPILITAVFVIEKVAVFAFARTAAGPSLPQVAAAAIGTLIILNPVELKRSVHSGYDVHPDHKGAAEFIKSLRLGPDAILIAEDVIVQRYYLAKLDYWLLDEKQAALFSRHVDGVLLDIYTDSRIMGNGEQLAALIDDPARGDIYIIGSGEYQGNIRSGMRGASLDAILSAGLFPEVYHGRDGLTKVWKIRPLPPGRRLADLLADPESARRTLGVTESLPGETQ